MKCVDVELDDDRGDVQHAVVPHSAFHVILPFLSLHSVIPPFFSLHSVIPPFRDPFILQSPESAFRDILSLHSDSN